MCIKIWEFKIWLLAKNGNDVHGDTQRMRSRYDLGQMILICAHCSIRTGPFMRLNTLQLRLAISVGGVWYDKDSESILPIRNENFNKLSMSSREDDIHIRVSSFGEYMIRGLDRTFESCSRLYRRWGELKIPSHPYWARRQQLCKLYIYLSLCEAWLVYMVYYAIHTMPMRSSTTLTVDYPPTKFFQRLVKKCLYPQNDDMMSVECFV